MHAILLLQHIFTLQLYQTCLDMSDLPTLPEFPGLSRKRDAYPLPRILVKNSRILCTAHLAHPYTCCRAVQRSRSERLARFQSPGSTGVYGPDTQRVPSTPKITPRDARLLIKARPKRTLFCFYENRFFCSKTSDILPFDQKFQSWLAGLICSYTYKLRSNMGALFRLLQDCETTTKMQILGMLSVYRESITVIYNSSNTKLLEMRQWSSMPNLQTKPTSGVNIANCDQGG